MAIQKKIYGFTLIETLIGILMTTIICSTLFLGITQAKLYLESIRIKEKAFIELKNFTNEWKSMVAAGVSNFPSDSNSGEKVALKTDANGNTTLEGNLYKKITRAANSGQYSVYYNIQTYITWDKKNLFFNKERGLLDTLSFNTYQIQFHIE
jgi:type II secretory pathway pseudopilin PulG|tara:strand:+ start:23554 stop:24009 length:456 start_codon:yes stop_codon:yes gene_type:complete